MHFSLLSVSMAASIAFTQIHADADPTPGRAMTNASVSSSSRETSVQPQPAVQAVLAAFRHYPVVALGMSHRLQDELDLALAIVRDPEFPNRANAVVLECGNSLYQDDMDRYVAGEDVPLERVQRFWRNTTQLGACAGAHPRDVIDLVRRINARLPRNRRLRILAGDPPIDWDRVQTAADIRPFQDRDGHFASVVEREVLAKHLRALLIVGSGHVLRRPVTWASQSTAPSPTITMLVERAYPHSMFVIHPHDGFSNRTAELEPLLSRWQVPSLALVRNTWLGRVDAATLFRGKIRRVGSDPNRPEDPFPGVAFQDLADAYLYFGPAASLRAANLTPDSDPAYAAELGRRIRLMGSFAGPVPVALPPSRS